MGPRRAGNGPGLRAGHRRTRLKSPVERFIGRVTRAEGVVHNRKGRRVTSLYDTARPIHERELGGRLDELSDVRRWFEQILAAEDPEWRQDALLVLDELASNALRHARGPFRVRLCLDPGVLLIEVHDGSTVPARVRTPDLEGGRGMHIIGTCAARWDQRIHETGKVVWAELSRGRSAVPLPGQ
ncbi:ATP-binding protein [Pseudonocardiaceae bacterium YIM PH 21723]|nr:ATP-binding protein [Pseudonocardiaceae bacterium YIM PH 21723]